MIERYSLKEMADIWRPETRFRFMLKVELTVTQAQADMGLIPKASARAILKKATFSYKNLQKREKVSRHDVVAFVDETAEAIGPPHGAWFHYGLTSSDVLDTALSLQIKASAALLNKSFASLKQTLKALAKKHRADICVGRTHGRHAEPTTFGYKLLGHLAELCRAWACFRSAVEEHSVGKISGAVGAYSSLPPELEKQVCRKLQLRPELVASQVVPRDRLAGLIFSLSRTGAFVERLSVELRHLQRTEVAEVEEAFYKGQAGSSAMPHKKNPISAENLTGIARLLRSYISPALENIALWHERDISHSSVERVIVPDAFILTHYSLNRLKDLLQSLRVDSRQMKANAEATGGLPHSSRLLCALVQKGLSRSAAYSLTQSLGMGLKKGERFSDKVTQNPRIQKLLSANELKEIFSGKSALQALLRQWDKIQDRLEADCN